LSLILLGGILSACQPANSPADAIENYLTALANKDQTAAVSYSCAEWEQDALAEGSSFINVEVTLENLSCQVDNETATEAEVSCRGKYLFSYDAGEDQELDLSGRSFSAILEAGEWRMCGYQK
jgi:hypothetical protein